MKVAKLILLAALLALLPLSAHAAGPTITLSPSPLQVPVGQVTPLMVKINNIEGLYGFDVQLKFDPAIVEIQDANPQTAAIEMLPGDFLSYDISLKNEVDNAAGTTYIVIGQLNPSEARSGSGVLFTLYVKGKAAGKSAFEIAYAKFADRNGMEISVEGKAGQVEVVSAAASGTTPVVNPTPLPAIPTPQIDLTAVVEQQAQTPAAPAQVEPAATAPLAATATSALVTTAAPVGTTAAAQDAATPRPTAAPASVTSPTAPAADFAATTAPAAVETPAVASASGATPGAGQTAAAPTAEPPAQDRAAASSGATVAPIVAAGGLNAPTRVASATQAGNSNTLLFAGGGLLLLAAAGAVTLILVRRGK